MYLYEICITTDLLICVQKLKWNPRMVFNLTSKVGVFKILIALQKEASGPAPPLEPQIDPIKNTYIICHAK